MRQNADRLISQWETKARSTNVAKLKSQYAAKAVEVREAARVLADTGLRRQYLQEIREKRERAFEASARQKIRPGTSEISRRAYQELMRSADSMRLAREHAEETLDPHLDVGGRQIRSAPTAGAGAVGERQGGHRRTFSFTLANVGQQKAKVQIEPLPACITVKQRKYTIGASETVNVSCQLAANLPPGTHSLQIEIQGPGGGKLDVYVTIPVPQPKLRHLGSLTLGRRLVNQVEQYAGTGQQRRRDVGLFVDRYRTVARAEPESRLSGAWCPRQIQVTADLRRLAPGKYIGRVLSRSNGGDEDVAVLVEVVEPQPATFELDRASVDLGRVDCRDAPSFELNLSNTGDLAGELVFAARRDCPLRTDAGRVQLGPGELRKVRFTFRVPHVASGTQLSEQVQLKAITGTVAVPQINVQGCVWVRPSSAHRFGVAMSVCAVPTFLVGVIAVACRNMGLVHQLLSFATIVAAPIAMNLFRKLWTGEDFNRSQVMNACGTLAGFYVRWSVASTMLPGEFSVSSRAVCSRQPSRRTSSEYSAGWLTAGSLVLGRAFDVFRERRQGVVVGRNHGGGRRPGLRRGKRLAGNVSHRRVPPLRGLGRRERHCSSRPSPTTAMPGLMRPSRWCSPPAAFPCCRSCWCSAGWPVPMCPRHLRAGRMLSAI